MASGVPYSHQPASYFGAGSGTRPEDADGEERSIFSLPKRSKLDPRVRWSNKTAATLHQEAESRLREIERNVAYFNGDQWAKNRAPWKNNVVLNYAAWICEQWTALLCDNKPNFTFESIKLGHETQAEIATAMRSFDEARDGWDAKREEAVLISRVKKEVFATPRYDPSAHGGAGGITMKVISPEHFFMNKSATCLEDAEYVLYEYRDTPGALLQRYKGLKRSLDRHRETMEKDEGYMDTEAGEQIGIPGQYGTTTSGNAYAPPRHDRAAERPGGGSSGVLVREWWLRPKGPKHQIKVKRLRWNAGNKIATRKKFYKFEDGHHEPLQTVITEGNVVYQLPMSVASLMQFVSDSLGGLKVLDVQDAVDPIYEEVTLPKYPAGRMLVIVGDHVADDGGNPFAHRKFPFAHLRARVNGQTKKTLGDIDLVYKQCEMLNRVVASMMDSIHQMGNPVWIVPIDEQMSDEDLTNAPGAIIRISPMASKLLRREPGQGFPPQSLQAAQLLIGQIKEISGLSDTATGGKFKGQQSSETVSMYQEAASVRFRQAIRLIQKFEEDFGRLYLGLCVQFYNTPMLVRVKNALGLDKHIEFLGSELDLDMTMNVKAGSGLASSPSARLNTTMALYGEGLTDRTEVNRKLQEAGAIDSAAALNKRVRKYANNLNLCKIEMPQLAAQLMGNQKQGKSNKSNAGRSARSTTANKARG
jgi:hypothetical protein